MDLVSDILLAAGAIGAAVYCFVLGKRLKSFNSLEKGVGGAVAVLSTQVEDLKKTLETAQKTAAESAETLSDLNIRAEETSKRLEIQLAALNDLPQESHPQDSSSADDGIAPSNPSQDSTSDGAEQSEPMFIRRVVGAAT